MERKRTKVNELEIALMNTMYGNGDTLRHIAKQLDRHVSTVKQHIKVKVGLCE